MKFVKPVHSKCDGVGACEKICAKTFFKLENPEYSSIRVNSENGKHSINVCNQCGECIDVCPVKAIYRNKIGTVVIKKDICVGCFMCVGFCPTHSMRKTQGQKEPFKCISCGACVKACQKGALSLVESDHKKLPS